MISISLHCSQQESYNLFTGEGFGGGDEVSDATMLNVDRLCQILLRIDPELGSFSAADKYTILHCLGAESQGFPSFSSF